MKEQHCLKDFSQFSSFLHFIRMLSEKMYFQNSNGPIALKKALPSKCLMIALRRSTVIILSVKRYFLPKQPKKIESHNTVQLSKLHAVFNWPHMLIQY